MQVFSTRDARACDGFIRFDSSREGGEYAFCFMVLPSGLWALEDDRRSVAFGGERGNEVVQ